ncbi:diguanylate cyclase/phosphodiesterase (GGDEF & EAL domains) with PAS/PAC sensor(s) (plasmid) [Sinorhizobium sojae CCBAU 05684]|uniref:Diguanylate cyclase/phosphodiesterase (GGDEF & EAL domains) with PAS/PAC sensor(S) n=1 Tax=Sinorhizobium sojae CCBAU 05684 TaxID=716928 RepID=A0A249PIG3_9HYPH|nr:diguanylate cyclase/phosphodiesterase (GGDEF & EAL domains) with PAS/PAC sensor(s) [Sinorhizobium sojae CCBAU 05684]
MLVGALLSYLSWAYHVHRLMDELIHEHGHEGFAEAIPAIVIIGILGLVYGVSRIRALRHEVHKRRLAEEHANWIARHDVLTGLPNRHQLAEFCARLPAKTEEKSAKYAVFSVDLDGFKNANDLVGHGGGDQILLTVAQRLQEVFAGEMICRVGGDEFLVFARREGFDPAACGRRIVGAVSMPILIGNTRAEIGASVGYALYPDGGCTIDDAIRQSDAALYAAKRSGRNTVRAFDEAIRQSLAKRLEIETALRQAIRDHAIRPYYQPLIDLRSGEIRGFEALARWETSDGRFIPPSDFIEVAESTGLITELSEQLLRAACADARSWPAHVHLSFNLSPTQLNDRLLGLRIVRILMEAGLSPKRLEVEITESALIHNSAAAETILSDLHEAGISVALDDFGTGYSSLSQLSKFKFDKIKIDRSFVTDLEHDDKQEKIVRAILGLGQGLGIATTAEGIEDEGQRINLLEMGCDCGQGYLFGKAVPAAAIPGLLAGASNAVAAKA